MTVHILSVFWAFQLILFVSLSYALKIKVQNDKITVVET